MYIMHSDQIQPQTPVPHFLPYPFHFPLPTLCVFFFFFCLPASFSFTHSHMESTQCCLYVCGYRMIQCCTGRLSGTTFLKKTNFPSPNSSLPKGQDFMNPLSVHAGIQSGLILIVCWSYTRSCSCHEFPWAMALSCPTATIFLREIASYSGSYDISATSSGLPEPFREGVGYRYSTLSYFCS